jgi:uncharacterized protein YndB with AHSA1/START domain
LLIRFTLASRLMHTFHTSRVIAAPIDDVFAAIRDPARLARWWGPKGFTNTFDVCEFKPGGRWLFTMHRPDGMNYPNENVFAEIDAPTRVVVQHLSLPTFRLTMTLRAVADGAQTEVAWEQVLDDAEFAKRVEHIIVPANEDNLDRLTAEVLRAAT